MAFASARTVAASTVRNRKVISVFYDVLSCFMVNEPAITKSSRPESPPEPKVRGGVGRQALVLDRGREL